MRYLAWFAIFLMLAGCSSPRSLLFRNPSETPTREIDQVVWEHSVVQVTMRSGRP